MAKTKPDLSFWKLWNLSFGFFGVQIAYALQSANVSRIFTTIGADPHDLSYFWILPPLMGLIVQPIVGSASDKTWNRFGRRLPYLIIGALVAIIVMCLLPNAGSFGLSVSSAILIGLFALMMLDTSINMAMQPFKMLVGDMVNEKQKGLAYSIQSFLCNAGSIIGYIFPFVFAWIGIQNVAPAGHVPPTVIWSFYIGAAILLLCVVYSLVKIKEWPPHVYNEYNGIEENTEKKAPRQNLFKLLVHAPKTFWTVGLVQFFCWFAFLFMWTYTTGTVARNAFDAPSVESVKGITYTDASGWKVTEKAKFILTKDNQIVVADNKAEMELSSLPANSVLKSAAIMANDVKTGELYLDDVHEFVIPDPAKASFDRQVELDAASEQYNAAGNWVGILFAVQAIGSVLWAIVLPRFRSRKFSYFLSLMLGAAGFISSAYISDPYLLFVSFVLIGCAWSAMLAWPFTILTNSLKGGNIGAYLGLFNCTICLPQIVAAISGRLILGGISSPTEVAPQATMMAIAGVMIGIGALCVFFIKEQSAEADV